MMSNHSHALTGKPGRALTLMPFLPAKPQLIGTPRKKLVKFSQTETVVGIAGTN